MGNQTILTVVDASCTEACLGPVLQLAFELDARLSVAVVGVAPSAHVYASAIPYGGMSLADDFGASLKEVIAGLTDKANEIEKVLQKSDVAGDVATIYSELAVLDAEIAKLAMICDIAVLPATNNLEDTLFNRALSGILFRSPIGVIVAKGDAAIPSAPKKVLVAWNTSLPAARAIHAALPILKQADEVIVTLFDAEKNKNTDGEDPGTDVAAWLSHLGCNVTLSQRPAGGLSVGKGIADAANETGSDLVVMGAYGHSRLQQWIFGGTTSDMLLEAGVPVLFAH